MYAAGPGERTFCDANDEPNSVLPVPKPHCGAERSRPALTCLPSENGVRLYAAGPGPSTPAREILSSSLERKTASACLRDE